MCIASIYLCFGCAQNSRKNIEYTTITFEVVDKEFSNEDFEDTYIKISERAYNLNSEAVVLKKDNNKIVVKFPKDDNASEEEMRDTIQASDIYGELLFVTGFNTDKEKVWLDGKDVKSAEAGCIKEDSGEIQYVVQLEFTEDGKEKFSEVTSKYVGQQMYIVIDGKVLSAPYINAQITSGEATISGMASNESAEELAAAITAGSLKLELQVID